MAQQLKPFRSLLEDLYITQNFKLDNIRDFMNAHHSINAGRCTYERLFKQWGFKKKNNGNDWAWNKPVPQETVRKEISRHVSTLQQSLHASGTAPSPPAPDGYTIVTPASSVTALTPRAPPTPGGEMQELRNSSPALTKRDVTVHPSIAAYNNETHSVDDGPTINLFDKAMVMEILESCGPFNLALGSSNMVLSPSSLAQIYDYAAECIVVTPQPTTRSVIPPNVAPFAMNFNVLLSAYREDVEFFRNFARTSNPEQYSDVLRAAIFMAAKKGALGLFETLFSLVGKDAKNNKGETYLHIASICNHPRVVEFLIEHKVQVNARCRRGFTPWTAIGCLDSHEEVSQLLIAAGAFIDDTRPTDSLNLLYEAAADGNVEHVRTLIRRGADPSYSTPAGLAPLHVAKTLDIIHILVKAGANVNHDANAGETPFDKHSHDYAKRQYLIAAGALPGFFLRPEVLFTPMSILSQKPDRA